MKRPVAEGGFMLHSSTNDQEHGVRRFANGGYKDYDNDASNDQWCEFLGAYDVGPSQIKVWLIDIPG